MEAALNGPSGRTTLGPTVLTIGRLPSNSLIVNDAKASSRHAEISPTGSGYSITDLGSTNGTFVNEQKLDANVSRVLNPGDKIRIGDTIITYEGASAFQQDRTVFADPSQGGSPGYQPTVAAPSPYTDYNVGGQQGYMPQPDYQMSQQAYQQPPVAYPSYIPVGQPAYGTPAYSGAPTAPKSNRNLIIALGAGGAAVVVVLVVLFFFILPSTPTKTLDAFCNALKVPDYQTAYNQFSNKVQAQGSESSFASAFGQAQINSCTHGSPSESGNNATSNITFFAASAPGTPVNGTVSLVKENGTWKIDNLNVPTPTGQ